MYCKDLCKLEVRTCFEFIFKDAFIDRASLNINVKNNKYHVLTVSERKYINDNNRCTFNYNSFKKERKMGFEYAIRGNYLYSISLLVYTKIDSDDYFFILHK